MKPSFAVLVHVGRNMWDTKYENLGFDRGLFEELMADCAAKGVTDVYLDLGEAIRYASHPEIAVPDALTVPEFKAMLADVRAAGLRPIPKLNFSASHDLWLGNYARMLCSKPYYTVCRDLIAEVSEIFEGPEFFHLGLDEEDYAHQRDRDYIVVRNGAVKWHDYAFYMDEVRKAGCRPVCWSDVFWYDPENCVKNVAKDVILMPWYYGSIRPEHYRPISEWDEWVKWYARPEYAGMNIEYVEQDPDWIRQRENLSAIPAAGYTVMPALSNYYGCRHNAEDVMEYMAGITPEEQLLGFITTSWKATLPEYREALFGAVDELTAAKAKIFGK